MLTKIDNSKKTGNSHISILYPGLYLSNNDTGYHSLGRIDHANIEQGVIIKMHPHVNDDILSYFRSGKVKHIDSEGFEEFIIPGRLMLMKAGKIFHHEEAVHENVEGLQIFIRPGKKDAQPEVIFQNLEEVHSNNKWRLIASPYKEKTKLQLSSHTFIYDVKITSSHFLQLPESPKTDLDYLLYVFQGTITVNESIVLSKGESLLISDEDIQFTTESQAELVLFVTDRKSPYYNGGMYSGNKKHSTR